MLLSSWLKSVAKRFRVSRPSRKSHGRRGIYDKARPVAAPSAEMLETRALLSAVTLASDVSDAGPINESAADEAGSGDDLTVNAGVTIESTGSDITYLAGDDIILQAGSVTRAVRSINLSVDFADADSGQGGVLNMADSGVLESGDETNILGGTDSDTFNIIPQLGTSLVIVGEGGDNVLNLDLTGTTGASLQSTVTGTTISFTSDHQPIQLNDVTEINVSNGTLAVDFSDAEGQTKVSFDGGDLVVSIAGQEVLRTDPISVSGPLTVNGTDASDDTLIIDFSNGNPIPSGINFNGGVGGNDTVEINEGSFANVGYTFTNENDGDVNWDGTTLTYTGLEPIIDNSNAVDRVFTFTGGAETITLNDDGTASDGFSLIDSTLGESVVFLNPTGSLTVNAGSGVDVIDLLGIDDATTIPVLTINGLAGNDTVDGSSLPVGIFTNVTINGGDGDDVLSGGTGTTLIGGDGIDRTSIDFGDAAVFLDLSNSTNGLQILERFTGESRTIDSFESVGLLTGDFRNIFRVFAKVTPSLQQITIDAGNGNNFINAWRTDLIIDVTTGSGNDVIWTGSANDTVSSGDGRDIIWTNSGDDIVGTGNGDNHVIAGLGNDTVKSGSGRDILRGGGGNDNLNSGDGNDRIFGNSGDDTLIAGAGNDALFGGWGDDTMDAGEGNDVAFGHVGNDSINGGGDNDRLFGGLGDDTLDGGEGNDWVIGNGGDDILIGGSGHDRIWGGTGRDLLFGGPGRDSLFGGSNDDLLISGSTTLNTNQIQSVRSEWASNRSLEIRLANITYGTGLTDRLNGDDLLNTSTLEADQDRDRLFGQSGIDSFFASATDRTVRSHFESLLDL